MIASSLALALTSSNASELEKLTSGSETSVKIKHSHMFSSRPVLIFYGAMGANRATSLSALPSRA